MRVSQGGTKLLLVVAGVFAVGGATAPQARADSEEGARKHAAKANQLAAKNKCKTAIFEFTRAYKTLKDPTLLFNRAECFRKVGRDEEAMNDYEQFLAEMPKAPNRAAVEARIVALRGAMGAGKVGTAPAAATKEPPAVPAPEPVAPAGKPADKAPAMATPPTAKPADKPAVAPTPPAAKPAVAPMAPAAKPAAPAAKPAEKAPAEPARRAEKWTD